MKRLDFSWAKEPEKTIEDRYAEIISEYVTKHNALASELCEFEEEFIEKMRDYVEMHDKIKEYREKINEVKKLKHECED